MWTSPPRRPRFLRPSVPPGVCRPPPGKARPAPKKAAPTRRVANLPPPGNDDQAGLARAEAEVAENEAADEDAAQ